MLITIGATEAISASLLALLEPGDEFVTFEPYFDLYAAVGDLCGATQADRGAALRDRRATRSIPTSSRAAVTRADEGAAAQHTPQPDRQGVRPRRADADRRPVQRLATWSRWSTRCTST